MWQQLSVRNAASAHAATYAICSPLLPHGGVETHLRPTLLHRLFTVHPFAAVIEPEVPDIRWSEGVIPPSNVRPRRIIELCSPLPRLTALRAMQRGSGHGKVWLLTAYAKAATDSISAATLVKLRKELIDD